jgi:hypothetical protein
MPTKRTELLKTDVAEELAHFVPRGDMEAIYAESFTPLFVRFILTR